MHETYYAGAYWGVRREAVGECARRAEFFFEMLARCDASLGQWYRAGRVARGSPGHLVHTNDREELEKLLLRGRSRTDLDKQIIEDLGFGVRFWNQEPDDRATKASIRCGAYAEPVSNSCLLDLPSQGESAERMQTLSTLLQVLTCMVTAWDPDWGVVNSSRALMELAPDAPMGDAAVGWMTYFSRRRGTVPPLPAPVHIEPVGSLGMLVILTPERFTASNPEHMALGRRVRELLGRAGLLSSRPAE
ncbi:MAG: immunity 52 family protein [Myxococcaceae bacterium]|nr:immunity 52 family protein [Myxococcaceae bacterium]